MPGLASMLDLNGDGNPLDDILRFVVAVAGAVLLIFILGKLGIFR